MRARWHLRVNALVVLWLVAAAVVFFQLKDTSLADRAAARDKPALTVREAVADSGYRAALDPTSPAQELLRLARARRRHGTPRTLLPGFA